MGADAAMAPSLSMMDAKRMVSSAALMSLMDAMLVMSSATVCLMDVLVWEQNAASAEKRPGSKVPREYRTAPRDRQPP